ncbi:FCD domain-containing protein, partial [Arthrobacter deserti]|nr:FCD domain-containing protein [Arthrobacter deserti]
ATVTAREALVGLRSRGLVSSMRGRDGGTFVTLPRGNRHQLVRDRLGGMSRVELRVLAIHYGAIASSADELAADFADQDDIAALRRLLADPPGAAPAPAGQAPGRVVGDFLLELAALSQSARLAREYVRLHTDFGSLLALAHADPEFDAPMRRLCADIAEAVGNGEPDAARHLVNRYVRAGLSRLITEHSRLTAAPAPSPTSGRTT